MERHVIREEGTITTHPADHAGYVEDAQAVEGDVVPIGVDAVTTNHQELAIDFLVQGVDRRHGGDLLGVESGAFLVQQSCIGRLVLGIDHVDGVIEDRAGKVVTSIAGEVVHACGHAPDDDRLLMDRADRRGVDGTEGVALPVDLLDRDVEGRLAQDHRREILSLVLGMGQGRDHHGGNQACKRHTDDSGHLFHLSPSSRTRISRSTVVHRHDGHLQSNMRKQ